MGALGTRSGASWVYALVPMTSAPRWCLMLVAAHMPSAPSVHWTLQGLTRTQIERAHSMGSNPVHMSQVTLCTTDSIKETASPDAAACLLGSALRQPFSWGLLCALYLQPKTTPSRAPPHATTAASATPPPGQLLTQYWITHFTLQQTKRRAPAEQQSTAPAPAKRQHHRQRQHQQSGEHQQSGQVQQRQAGAAHRLALSMSFWNLAS